MLQKRKSGVLLHITSLPSKYGIGTLGAEAIHFIDWLSESGMSLWQILPLVPTNYGDSPYQSVSSSALNYYLIDFDVLYEKGLLKKKDYVNQKYGYSKRIVDYRLLFNEKINVLKTAFSNFNTNDKKFLKFVNSNKYRSFGVFMTIKALHNYNSWELWTEGFRVYSKKLEKDVIENFHTDYLFWIWTQYEFLEEWNKIHSYARKKKITIIGDMPLYVAYDSVEVWVHPELFNLDDSKRKNLVAGYPPDKYSKDGQLWGNPTYNWDNLKKTNYSWWNERLNNDLELFDIVRLDHFRGFEKYYAIKASDNDATNGIWINGPGFDFFKDKLELPIIVDDLGNNDKDVDKLIEKTNYPGMKVLEFGFDGDLDNTNKPSNFNSNHIVYTTTHDNKPLYQYILDLNEQEKDSFIKDVKRECKLLNVKDSIRGDKSLVNTIIELAFASNGIFTIIPMQDLLLQGKESRMNIPSTVNSTNWAYRIISPELSKSLSAELKILNTKYRR